MSHVSHEFLKTSIIFIVSITLLLVYTESNSSEVSKDFSLPKNEIKHFIKRIDKKVSDKTIMNAFYRDYVFNPIVIQRLTSGKKYSKQEVIKYKNIKVVNWKLYQKIFIQEKRVLNGVTLYLNNKNLFDEVEKKYGVDSSIILAILGIETKYGKVMGKYSVMSSLITNSFHPLSHRKSFYRKQLVAFFSLIEENPFMYSAKGSYAGAMGMGQFIPTSYQHYTVDYDKDSQVNLFTSLDDAVASIANYLLKNKWVEGQKVAYLIDDFGNSEYIIKDSEKGMIDLINAMTDSLGDIIHKENTVVFIGKNQQQLWQLLPNFKVIKRYNSLNSYAMAVYTLSEKIKKKINEQ